MTIQHFPADAEIDVVAAAVSADGCAVVDNLIDHETINRVRTELRPFLEQTAKGDDEFLGHATRRAGAIVERSPTARTMVTHPLVLGASEKVIREKNRGVQLHVTQLISIGPGESAQDLHRDQWAWDFFPFPEGHEVMVNCMWALSDFTAENGATRVAPGSKKYKGRELPSRDEIEVAEMKAGSVCLFAGSTFHGGGANETSSTRDGLIIAYCASWLRQEENQYLSVSRETALELDEPLLRLLGYDQLYSLGYWADYNHPLEALGVEPQG